MALLDFLFGDREKKSTDISAYTWTELLGQQNSRSGVSVNVDTALKVSTVLACARVLAEGVAQLPLKVIRTTGDKRTDATDHPLFDLLYRHPNDFMTSFELREQMMFHAVLTGNAYAYIGWAGRPSRIVELIPMVPGSVTPIRGKDFSLTYRVSNLDGTTTTFDADSILHIRGPSWNGYLGLDAVQLAREAIGLAIATEETHASLHANGAQPGGVLTVKGKLDDAARDRLKLAWAAFAGGTGSKFKTAVVDMDSSWSPMTMKGVDTQHIETRKFQIQEICRVMRVFPLLVMDSSDTATYASSTAFLQAHWTHSLQPWVTRWEQSLAKTLLDAKTEGDLIIKFNANAILRGTPTERQAFYAGALGGARPETAWMTRNEVRALEDLDPIEGGDELPKPEPVVAPGGAKPAAKGFFKYDPDEPRDPHGMWTDSGGGMGNGSTFVSPNTGNVDFATAVTSLGTTTHAMTAQAIAAIDQTLGIKSEVSNVVGAWADGAENSTMTVSHGASWEQLQVAAAMKGSLANQKQVLVFQHTGEGNAFLASFNASGKLADIHSHLLAIGLTFHTLEPTATGAKVHVYGEDDAAHAQVISAAHVFNTTAEIKIGMGKFLGTTKEDGTDADQRKDAQQIYSGIIRQFSKSSGDSAEWRWLYNRYRQAREGQVKNGPIDEPRDPHGMWTDGGGGDARTAGETDKAFAKRVVDKRPVPDTLPEDHAKYFVIDSTTTIVPLDKLVSSKSDAETAASGPNAARRMAAAANGELEKRVPISVELLPSQFAGKSKYFVLDGNSSTAAARAYGWQHMPVTIVSGAIAGILATGAKELADLPANPHGNRVNAVSQRVTKRLLAIGVPSSEAFAAGYAVVRGEGSVKYNPNHLPGGDEHGGEFAPGDGGGGGDTRSDMSRSTGNDRQPVSSLDHLYDLAHKGEANFLADVRAIARLTGGDAQFTPLDKGEKGTTLKPRASAERKLAEENGDASKIKDILRGTVVHTDWIQTRQAVAQFLVQKGSSIIRVKDRLAKVGKDGYRDMLVNYRTKDGLVAEVQFNTKAMAEVKSGIGHDLYREAQLLIKPGIKTPIADLRKIATLNKRQQTLYNDADLKAGNGKWKVAA